MGFHWKRLFQDAQHSHIKCMLCNAVVMREEALSLVYYMMFFSYLYNILTAGPGDPAAPAGPCIPIEP